MIVGTIIMAIFSFGSDTILQSYFVDLELNRGDGMRPAIMAEFIDSMPPAEKKAE
jgi:hypothetical protein